MACVRQQRSLDERKKMTTAKQTQKDESPQGNVVISDVDEVLIEGSSVHNLAIQKCEKVIIREVTNPF